MTVYAANATSRHHSVKGSLSSIASLLKTRQINVVERQQVRTVAYPQSVMRLVATTEPAQTTATKDRIGSLSVRSPTIGEKTARHCLASNWTKGQPMDRMSRLPLGGFLFAKCWLEVSRVSR